MYCGALERIMSTMSCCTLVRPGSLSAEAGVVAPVVETGEVCEYQSSVVSDQSRTASWVLVGWY